MSNHTASSIAAQIESYVTGELADRDATIRERRAEVAALKAALDRSAGVIEAQRKRLAEALGTPDSAVSFECLVERVTDRYLRKERDAIRASLERAESIAAERRREVTSLKLERDTAVADLAHEKALGDALMVQRDAAVSEALARKARCRAVDFSEVFRRAKLEHGPRMKLAGATHRMVVGVGVHETPLGWIVFNGVTARRVDVAGVALDTILRGDVTVVGDDSTTSTFEVSFENVRSPSDDARTAAGIMLSAIGLDVEKTMADPEVSMTTLARVAEFAIMRLRGGDAARQALAGEET